MPYYLNSFCFANKHSRKNLVETLLKYGLVYRSITKTHFFMPYCHLAKAVGGVDELVFSAFFACVS